MVPQKSLMIGTGSAGLVWRAGRVLNFLLKFKISDSFNKIGHKLTIVHYYRYFLIIFKISPQNERFLVIGQKTGGYI